MWEGWCKPHLPFKQGDYFGKNIFLPNNLAASEQLHHDVLAQNEDLTLTEEVLLEAGQRETVFPVRCLLCGFQTFLFMLGEVL